MKINKNPILFLFILFPFFCIGQYIENSNLTLTNFTGENDGTKNVLTWVTFTEINNDYFTIEISIDGQEFKTIDILKGSGTCSKNNKYVVYDEDFPADINYYRLMLTDFDGENEYSEMISIDNRIAVKSIRKIVNILGQEVDESYAGEVIIIYSDNSFLRTFQNL